MIWIITSKLIIGFAHIYQVFPSEQNFSKILILFGRGSERPKISERRNGLFSWSERRKSKRSERRKCLLSWSLLQHHNVENGFWVDHYIEKNEKNIENLNFVWFLHFNYLWRHFNYLWHMVLWTTGIKKWIFKNSPTWLKLT